MTDKKKSGLRVKTQIRAGMTKAELIDAIAGSKSTKLSK
jgi:hypothetical protein